MRPEEVVRGFFADNEYPLGFVGAVEKWFAPEGQFMQNGVLDCKNRAELVAQFDGYNCLYKRPYARVTVKELTEVGNTVFVQWEEECYNHDNGDTYVGKLFAKFVIENDKIILRSDWYDMSHYKFGVAMYIPKQEEVQAYRAYLGYKPHEEKDDFSAVAGYHLD